MDKLARVFAAYFALANSRLDRPQTLRRRGALSLLPNSDAQVVAVVEELEASREFEELVRSTQEAFRGDFHSAKREDRWKWPVRAFFRRTGFYIQTGNGVSVDPERLFSCYCEAFGRREKIVRYLASLEFIEFARPRLDCGSFEVRRFSRSELDEFLGSEVNRLFYSYALANTALLSNYWFLIVNEVEQTSPISSRITSDLSAIGSVFPSYSPPPAPVERALRVLALFDWRLATRRFDYFGPAGWIRFGLPIIIRVSDDLLSQPRGGPSVSVLQTETQCDQEGEEYEVPAIYADIEEATCDRLVRFCLQIGQALKEIPPDSPWHFFEVSVTHFLRAFLTKGLDQLLWHTTALEALLGGGHNEPIRRTIGTRLGAILGETESDRRAIRKRFNDFYDLRCDMVHGNRLIDSAAGSDLAELRELARRVLLWFVHWLHAIQTNARTEIDGPLPGRAEMLTALDLTADQRDRVASLLRHLPSSFPYVREWLE